jgi:hypothetical protein
VYPTMALDPEKFAVEFVKFLQMMEKFLQIMETLTVNVPEKHWFLR